MSYARFGWDGSDVYVIHAGDLDALECYCADRFVTPLRSEMVSHLMAHRERGDCVPQEAMDELTTEIEHDGDSVRAEVPA